MDEPRAIPSAASRRMQVGPGPFDIPKQLRRESIPLSSSSR